MVSLYDAHVGQRERAVLGGHTGLINSAVFSPNGAKILTAGEDGKARLWDRDGKPLDILEGHTAPVKEAVFAPDGSRILTASRDSTARLWDPDGKPLAILRGHTYGLYGAVFAPDGGKITFGEFNIQMDRLTGDLSRVLAGISYAQPSRPTLPVKPNPAAPAKRGRASYCNSKRLQGKRPRNAIMSTCQRKTSRATNW
jgi:hypothetical protein